MSTKKVPIMSTQDFMQLLVNTIVVAVVGFLVLQLLGMLKAHTNKKMDKYVTKEEMAELSAEITALNDTLVEIRDELRFPGRH